VPLEFRGLAIMHPNGKEARFAGYPVGNRSAPIVICLVTRDVLLSLGNVPAASDEDLLTVFDLYKDEIQAAASKQFDDGVHRPTVTPHDMQPIRR
jgi:hypothetical protein